MYAYMYTLMWISRNLKLNFKNVKNIKLSSPPILHGRCTSCFGLKSTRSSSCCLMTVCRPHTILLICQTHLCRQSHNRLQKVQLLSCHQQNKTIFVGCVGVQSHAYRRTAEHTSLWHFCAEGKARRDIRAESHSLWAVTKKVTYPQT